MADRERPRPWQTLKTNLGSGFDQLDRVFAAHIGVSLAGFPLWATVHSVPGLGSTSFAPLVVSSVVAALVLSQRYSRATLTRLQWFGVATAATFVALGWLLSLGLGVWPGHPSRPVALGAAVAYGLALSVAYVLCYRQWYTKAKVRLRLARRKRE